MALQERDTPVEPSFPMCDSEIDALLQEGRELYARGSVYAALICAKAAAAAIQGHLDAQDQLAIRSLQGHG